jgi:hypothetical protein
MLVQPFFDSIGFLWSAMRSVGKARSSLVGYDGKSWFERTRVLLPSS